MSDKIEIKVMINDQPGTLADVSLETLTGLRDKVMPTVEPVKPIEHGDYGEHNGAVIPGCRFRLFIKNVQTGKIDSYSEFDGRMIEDVNRDSQRGHYTIFGNIFKDMRGKSNDNP